MKQTFIACVMLGAAATLAAQTAPTVDQILTNDFVGSVKLSDSEWSAAEKRFEPYRKYVG